MKKRRAKYSFSSSLKPFTSIFIFLLLVSFLGAKEPVLRFQGEKGISYFDRHGNLNLIYIDINGHINRAFTLSTLLQDTSSQNINLFHNVHSIDVKKDRKGNVWLAWEEAQRKKIYTAQLRNNTIFNKKKMAGNEEGFSISPQIDFSHQNELWITWVNYDQKKQSIMVKNRNTGQTWEIFSSECSALDPQILIDGTGKVWVFWVANPKLEDEILACYFDGVQWSPIIQINKSSQVPHLYPCVSLDHKGFPYLLWSSFDGKDYELYSSGYNGSTWKREKITNNQNTADTSPSISFLFHSIPIAAWKRYQNGRYELCVTYKIEEEWSPGVIIAREDYLNSPHLDTHKEKIALTWETKKEVKSKLLSFPELIKLSWKRHLQKRMDLSQFNLLNLAETQDLNRDKYIGFGNSITYGIINLELAPEKGYVPRLDNLIDQNIKESQVVNQGEPGEKTAEGLSRINSVINSEQAKTIFLMEGTNDVKDESISMSTAAFNLKKMAERCLNHNMTVFLASIIPKKPWEGLFKERTLDLNSRIQNITNQLSIPFVDQFEAFYTYDESPHGWHALYSDATHPNEKGYQLMAETWYDGLEKTLPRINTDSSSLSFEATYGKSNPPSQTFKIRNSGSGRLNYSLSPNKNWISVSPQTGNSTGEWDEIQVSVDISNLSPGSYTGYVTITDEYARNSPQQVTVNLTVKGPMIELDQPSLSFEAVKGEGNPESKTFQVRNSGELTLNYEITTNRNWISLSPQSGDSTGEWDEVEVSVNISNLSQGTYSGTVTVKDDDASNSPQQLTVNLTILGPTIQTDKSSLSFEGIKGEGNPPAKSFQVKNSGEGTLNYKASPNKDWISVTPQEGDSTGEWDEVEVSVNISELSRGEYTGKITLSDDNADNSPQQVTVEVSVLTPLIELDPTSLSFEAQAAEGSPPSQTLKIRNSGAGTLAYQLSEDKEWLSLSPESGESEGEWDEVEVSVDISDLTEENYQGTITVTEEYAANSPQEVPVDLHIEYPPLYSPQNFRGEKKINKSLTMVEVVVDLKWEAHPENQYIENYRLYLMEDEKKNLLKEFDAGTFEYWHRKLEEDKTYRYALTALDQWGRESEPAYVEVR